MWNEQIERAKKHPGKLVPVVHAESQPKGILQEGIFYIYSLPTTETHEYRKWVIKETLQTDVAARVKILGFFKKHSSENKARFEAACEIPILFEDCTSIEYIFRDIKKHFQKHTPELAKQKYFGPVMEALAFHTDNIPLEKIVLDRVVSENLCLTGFSEPKEEKPFAKELLDRGATTKQHVMKIPDYKSWATIDPGATICLEEKDFVLEYIPREPIVYNQSADFDFKGSEYMYPKSIEQLEFKVSETMVSKAQQNIFKELFRSVPLYSIALEVDKKELPDWIDPNSIQKLFNVELYKSRIGKRKSLVLKGYYSAEQIVKEISKIKHIDAKQWSKRKQAAQETNSFLKQTLNEKNRFSFRCLGQKWSISVAEHSNRLISRGGYEKTGFANCFYLNDYHAQAAESFAIGLQKMIGDKTNRFSLTSTDPFSPSKKELGNLSEHEKEQRLLSWFNYERTTDNIDAPAIALDTWKKMGLKINAETKTAWHLKAPAPFSEKGRILIDIKNPENFSVIMEELQKLGLSAWAEVDTEQTGRVNPLLEKYSLNKDLCPVIPKGKLIMHGMTGIDNRDDALERLKEIINCGGLLSYSERRRNRLAYKSMSPIGDMASGIDWGVPFTINHKPSYGKWIVFVLKPEVLKRKHLFFSDRDYGGGKDRHDAYNQYAKKIGQPNFFSPPSHDARQRHLDSLAQDSSELNELWLRWMVSWEEIDCVLIAQNSNLYKHASGLIKKAKAQGDIPESLKVYKFSSLDYEAEKGQDNVGVSESLQQVLDQIITQENPIFSSKKKKASNQLEDMIAKKANNNFEAMFAQLVEQTNQAAKNQKTKQAKNNHQTIQAKYDNIVENFTSVQEAKMTLAKHKFSHYKNDWK